MFAPPPEVVMFVFLLSSMLINGLQQPSPSTSFRSSLDRPYSFLSYSLAEAAVNRRLRQNMLNPEQIRLLHKAISMPVEEMDRQQSQELLAHLYRVPVADITDLTRDLTVDEIRNKVLLDFRTALEQDEDAQALSKIEASDLPSVTRMNQVGIPAGKTGFFVGLMNWAMKKFFDYDMLENAQEEIRKARVRVERALKQNISLDEVDERIVKELAEQVKNKTREYHGSVFNPFIQAPTQILGGSTTSIAGTFLSANR